jgi:hypothetical protein
MVPLGTDLVRTVCISPTPTAPLGIAMVGALCSCSTSTEVLCLVPEALWGILWNLDRGSQSSLAFALWVHTDLTPMLTTCSLQISGLRCTWVHLSQSWGGQGVVHQIERAEAQSALRSKPQGPVGNVAPPFKQFCHQGLVMLGLPCVWQPWRSLKCL